ncbi:MAG: DUF5105 domain-containing protein [Erysipelotrichia bacterium]|nr:DUF5105 domain-containing protein [Erysipelotrichia bacterium]
MKKILTILLSLTMILSLTACAQKPETAVKEFLDKCKSGNLEEIADYNDEVLDEEYAEIFKSIISNVTYKISGAEQTADDEAIVKTQITTVDMSETFQNIISETLTWAFGQALSGKEPTEEETYDKMMELFNSSVEKNKDKTKTFDLDIQVIKDSDGKWQVDIDDDLIDALSGGLYSSVEEMLLEYASGDFAGGGDMQLYSKSGLSIELPAGLEDDSDEYYDLFLYNDDYAFMAIKESFDLFTENEYDPNTMSIDDYCKMIVDINELNDQFEKDSYNNPYMAYINEVEGENYYYYTTVRKGSDAFWIVTFYTFAAQKDNYASQFEQWANTIVVN